MEQIINGLISIFIVLIFLYIILKYIFKAEKIDESKHDEQEDNSDAKPHLYKNIETLQKQKTTEKKIITKEKKTTIKQNLQIKETKTNQQNIEIKPQLKINWKDFESIVNQNEILALYHITDQRNIESIKKHGFLGSWHYLEQNGIKNVIYGGNNLSRELDIKCNLYDYVRLAFTTNLPMIFIAKKEGRMPNPYVLEFKVEPIYFTDTIYCPINATDNNAISNGSIDTFKRIRFDIIKQIGYDDDSESRKYKQAEVLVKTKLSYVYILKEPYRWKG